MSPFKLIEQSKGIYSVEGDLTFSSLNKIGAFDFLNSAKTITIDMKKIDLADSAGLALVVEWIKKSIQFNTTLTLKNFPHQLLTLAKLTHLDLNDYLADI